MKILSFFILLTFSVAQASENYYIAAKNWFDGEKFNRNVPTYFEISNGKIVSITSRKPSDKANVISAGNNYLLPGLTDGHTHVFLSSKPKTRNYDEILIRNSKLSKKERIKLAEDTLRSYMESGFTSLIDLGNSGQFLEKELKNNIINLFFSGPGIAVNHGQYSNRILLKESQREYQIVDFNLSLDEQLQQFIKHKVDYIKVFADNDPGEGSINLEKLILMKKWSRLHKFKMHVHATNSQSLNIALDAQSDFIHHVYKFDSFLIEKMQKSGALLIPTYLGPKLSSYVDEDRERAGDFELQKKMFKLENVAFGSDTYFEIKGFSRGRQAIEALLSLKNWQLTNAEVLSMATSRWSGRIGDEIRGLIKVGAVADLVISGPDLDVSLNSLVDINMVIVGGKIVYDRTRVKKRK